jgi:hypothetical protein
MCDSSIIYQGKDGTSRSDNEVAKSFDELLSLKGVIATGGTGPNRLTPRLPIKGDTTSR